MQSMVDSADTRGADPMAVVPSYNLLKLQHSFEDIIFCIDTDRQMETELKSAGTKGQGLSRMDSVKQAILLFVHSKLTINPNHRFAFATLGYSATWRHREFTNDIGKIRAIVAGLAADALYLRFDLTQLFKMAATEAKYSHSQSRTLRVELYDKEIIQLKNCKIPKGLLTLESLFSPDDVYKGEKKAMSFKEEDFRDVEVQPEKCLKLGSYILQIICGARLPTAVAGKPEAVQFRCFVSS